MPENWPKIEVAPDLSSTIATSEAGKVAALGAVNPKTQEKWANEQAIRDYVHSVLDNPLYWSDPEPAKPETLVSVHRFINELWTIQEHVKVEQAIQNGNLLLKVAMERLKSFSDIDLDASLIIDMLAHCVSVNILTPDRVARIRSNQEPESA